MHNRIGRWHARLVGYRTLILAALLGFGPELLDYLKAVDWQAVGFDPHTATAICVAFSVARIVTKAPVPFRVKRGAEVEEPTPSA